MLLSNYKYVTYKAGNIIPPMQMEGWNVEICIRATQEVHGRDKIWTENLLIHSWIFLAKIDQQMITLTEMITLTDNTNQKLHQWIFVDKDDITSEGWV